MKFSVNAKMLDAVGKPTKRLIYGVTDSKNLFVVVETSGKISWKWQGKVDGRTRQVLLGTYPRMGLAEARKASARLTEARDIAKETGSSIEVPRVRQRSSSSLVVPVVAPAAPLILAQPHAERDCNWLWDEYFKRDCDGQASAHEKQRCWNKDISPVIGHIPYTQVTFDELFDLIDDVSEERPSHANHLVSYIKRMFRWAITDGYRLTKLEIDPAAKLVKPNDEKKRNRFLSRQEIIWFFRTAATLPGTFTDGLIFALYNGTRRKETYGMPWTEFDEHERHWLLPTERTKNSDPLLLPLHETSLELLAARKAAGSTGRYVFPSMTDKDKPLTAYSRFMGPFREQMLAIAAEERGEPVDIVSWSIHDMRRTLNTGMNGLKNENHESLIPGDIVERVCNHRMESVRGNYNWHEYEAEKRRALMLWGEHLDALREIARQSPLQQAA